MRMPACDQLHTWIRRQLFLCPMLEERCPSAAACVDVCFFVGARHALGQPHAQLRMQRAKTPYCRLAAQHGFQHSVLVIAFAETVAMRDDGIAAAELSAKHAVEYAHTDIFFEKSAAPSVVISTDHRHGYTGIDDVG